MTKRQDRPFVSQRTALVVLIASLVAIATTAATALMAEAQTHSHAVTVATSFCTGVVAFLGTLAKLDQFIE